MKQENRQMKSEKKTRSGKKSLQLDYKTYQDKVLGAWIGKSIGGIVGAPFESHKIRGEYTADMIWPDSIAPNDDLDIQVAWLELMEERGCFFSRQDMVEMWQDRCWYNFAEYGHFLNNVQRGIRPPLSGEFNNEFFRESMGCPIRAEIWGLVSPGNPALAAELARMDGELDHVRESVWAEQFWAAANASAFFTHSLKKVMDAGRKVVPHDSGVFFISSWVPKLWQEHGDWHRVWMELIRRFGDRDSSKGLIDFGFTVLSLLANNCDMKATVTMCVNCGWDVDCTAATAAALLGTLNGAEKIPSDWREKTGANLTCAINVKHRNASLAQFARDTCLVGLEMRELRNGNLSIANVPEDVRSEVARRIAARPERPDLEMNVTYPDGPVLKAEGDANAVVSVTNLSRKSRKGRVMLNTAKRLNVSPARSDVVSIGPGKTANVKVKVRRKAGEKVVWDKNLVRTRWRTGASKKTVDMTFGFAGARQWTVYGPYWDGWDTRQDAICPFRNEKKICHPCHIGYGDVMFRNFVDLDREYLDEKRLLKQSVPAEWPFKVERGEDWLRESDLGGFNGEAVYYFVRELVADPVTECRLTIGCSAPFKAWFEGEEIVRRDIPRTWNPGGGSRVVTLDSRPRRLVIKTARVTDEFMMNLWFSKTNVQGDGTVGISYMHDSMGDRLIDG